MEGRPLSPLALVASARAQMDVALCRLSIVVARSLTECWSWHGSAFGLSGSCTAYERLPTRDPLRAPRQHLQSSRRRPHLLERPRHRFRQGPGTDLARLEVCVSGREFRVLA